MRLPWLWAICVLNSCASNTNRAYWVHRQFLEMRYQLVQKFHRKDTPKRSSTVIHWSGRSLQLYWHDAPKFWQRSSKFVQLNVGKWIITGSSLSLNYFPLNQQHFCTYLHNAPGEEYHILQLKPRDSWKFTNLFLVNFLEFSKIFVNVNFSNRKMCYWTIKSTDRGLHQIRIIDCQTKIEKCKAQIIQN